MPLVPAALKVAYRVQRKLWHLIRPRTRGVKLMLFDPGGRLLLIRNSYGSSHLWVLPGGGVRPWEDPAKAAFREAREELAATIDNLRHRSTHQSEAEGKRDTIHLFSATVAGRVEVDGAEVLEAAWFTVELLPDTVSPATRRRVDEWLGGPVSGEW